MTDYKLNGMTKANLSADRNSFILFLDTDKGQITLTMDAAMLDHFSTSLQSLEQQASIMQPASGAMPGEPVELRVYIVDGFQVGIAIVSNVPCVAAIIESGNLTRTYAFDRQKAEGLSKALADAIPELATGKPN